MKKLFLAGFALLFIGAGSALDAASNASLLSGKPEDIRILSELTPDHLPPDAELDSLNWRKASGTPANNRNITMSFWAQESGTLDYLGMYIKESFGGGNGSYSLTIREYDSMPTVSGNTWTTQGRLMRTISGNISVPVLSSTDSTLSSILQFEFSDEDVVSLVEGKFYTVVFNWTGSEWAPDKNFGFRVSTLPTNDLGETISGGGWHLAGDASTWTHSEKRNYLFYAGSIAAVPEVSTGLLFTVAAAGMLIKRRKK